MTGRRASAARSNCAINEADRVAARTSKTRARRDGRRQRLGRATRLVLIAVSRGVVWTCRLEGWRTLTSALRWLGERRDAREQIRGHDALNANHARAPNCLRRCASPSAHLHALAATTARAVGDDESDGGNDNDDEDGRCTTRWQEEAPLDGDSNGRRRSSVAARSKRPTQNDEDEIANTLVDLRDHR